MYVLNSLNIVALKLIGLSQCLVSMWRWETMAHLKSIINNYKWLYGQTPDEDECSVVGREQPREGSQR